MLLIKWNAFANSESSFTVIVDLNTPSRIPSEAVLNPLWLRTWRLHEEPSIPFPRGHTHKLSSARLPILSVLPSVSVSGISFWYVKWTISFHHKQFGPKATVHTLTQPGELWESTPCVAFVFKTHGKWVPWCLGQILTVGHKSTFHGGTSVPASQAQDSPHTGEWSLLKSYIQFLQFSSSFRRSRSRSWWPGMQENTSEEMTRVSSDKSILWGKIALSRHRR